VTPTATCGRFSSGQPVTRRSREPAKPKWRIRADGERSSTEGLAEALLDGAMDDSTSARGEPPDSGTAAEPADQIVVGKAVLRAPRHEPVRIDRIGQNSRCLVGEV
jgi:hypothetical protein